MLRIINDNNSHWASWVLPDPPRLIREAISWVEPTKPFKVRVRENAELQERIDKASAITAPKWARFKQAHGWPEVTAKRENPEAMKKLRVLMAARS
jgi:hypothetical protein